MEKAICSCITVLFTILISGCGVTNINERYYYAVPSSIQGDESVNYYRLTLTGSSWFGVVQYKSGYFPARAVDSYLGNVELDKGARELEIEDKLMSVIDKATLKTWQDYISEIKVNDKILSQNTDKTILSLDKARRLLLQYPKKSGTEIDYNPAGNIVTMNANNKLCFFMSSNPDEVMSKISSFAEDEKTIQSINRLSLVISEPKTKEASVADIQLKSQELQMNTIAARMLELKNDENMNESDCVKYTNEITTLLNSLL